MASEVFNTINQGTATLSQYTGPSVFAQVADQLAPAKGWLGGSASPFPTLVAIEAIALGAAIHSNQARDDSYLYARVGAYALPFFLRQLVQAFPTSLSFASGWYPIKDMGFDDLMKNPTYWIPSLVIYNVAMHFIAHRLCPKNKRGDYRATFSYNETKNVLMKRTLKINLNLTGYQATYTPRGNAQTTSLPASIHFLPSGIRFFKLNLIATAAAAAISHYTTPNLENPYIPITLLNEALGVASMAVLSKRKVIDGYLTARFFAFALSGLLRESIHMVTPSGLNFHYLKPLLTIAKDKPQLADISIEALRENPPLWIGSILAYNIALYTFGAWAVRRWRNYLPSRRDTVTQTVFVPLPRKISKSKRLGTVKHINFQCEQLPITFNGTSQALVGEEGFFNTMKTHLYAMCLGTAITIMLRHHWEWITAQKWS